MPLQRSICLLAHVTRAKFAEKRQGTMIQATRLDNTVLVLNSDLIEHIESTPDTVVTLTNGRRWIVRESVAEVVERIIEYQRAIRMRPVQDLVQAHGAPALEGV